MMVVTRGDGSISRTQTGMRRWTNSRQRTLWVTVFSDPHNPDDVPERFNTNADENMSILTAKTAVHEIGHHLRVGEADDQCCWTENYSGRFHDQTPEYVQAQSTVLPPDEWSVMSSGHPEDMFIAPTGTRYTAFSLEELFTVTDETPNR